MLRMEPILVCLSLALCNQAFAAGDGAEPGADTSVPKPTEGTVYTYYGLRKLELDSSVSDEDKLKEWEAFIERTKEQVGYANKAIARWKNAARLRVIESVQSADTDPNLTPREKMDRWQRLQKLYPRSREAVVARKRIAHWKSAETKRLVEAAEEVERANGPKSDRVQAWKAVADWVKKGAEAKAARRRIGALQKQLFVEAQSLDTIGRVDSATKLAVWQDVLAGLPTAKQRKVAERRIKALRKEQQAAAPPTP